MISEDIVTLHTISLITGITDISAMTITDDAFWISVMMPTTGELINSRRTILKTTITEIMAEKKSDQSVTMHKAPVSFRGFVFQKGNQGNNKGHPDQSRHLLSSLSSTK